MTLPRVITAVLLVPLVVAVVWFGSLPFFIFVLGLSLLSLWEYSMMAEEGGYPNQMIMLFIGGLLIVLALYFDGSPMGPIRKAPGPLFILVLWTFLVCLREFFRSDKGHSLLRIITTVSGVLLLGLFLGHLVLLRDLRMAAGEGYVMVGRPVTFFLIVIIWIVDTGAWFVGKLIGRFPLARMISPKKTWEGAIGGTIIGCLAGLIFRAAFLKNEMGPLECVCYALAIAVSAQLSGLISSLIKRSFGVKDSSQLLPGHGGFMDRFDSFIFAAPFYYYALIATGRFF